MNQPKKKPIAAGVSKNAGEQAFKKKIKSDWAEFVAWLKEPFWRTVCLLVAILFSVGLCLPAIQNCDVVKNYNGQSWYLFSQPDYVQAADAVMKGQVYLDIQASDELLALKNPYDPGSREGVLYLWDHAFYNGHYYMYFGLAPVFTVYLPFYAVTSEMPNNVLACMILAIYCCFTIPLALFEWARRFAPKTSPFLLGFASFVLVAVSGVYLHVSYSKQYQIPILSATAMGFLFCYLVLRALRCKKAWKRYVVLALAGVSYVATVASRPTMALMFLAPLPIVFFDILKPFELKKAAKDLCALGIPVLIGAVLIMCYNYARFGNPLDFGQKYQLTVHEVSLYSLSGSMFGYAMIHYFFQMPTFDGTPTLPCRSLLQMNYGRYVYVDRSIGVFAFPTTLGTLFSAAVISFKKDPGKAIAYVFIPVCAIALAFVDFCLAGVHLRYVFDIVPMMTFLGLLVWIELCKKATGKNKAVLTCVGIALCFAALAVSYGLVMTHGGAGSQEPECLFHKL
ncbi:MAG: hypothetical protein MJ083_03990 [Clostridia bacterium]|nr:hypothetical protein [Clostridia bacterium]